MPGRCHRDVGRSTSERVKIRWHSGKAYTTVRVLNNELRNLLPAERTGNIPMLREGIATWVLRAKITWEAYQARKPHVTGQRSNSVLDARVTDPVHMPV